MESAPVNEARQPEEHSEEALRWLAAIIRSSDDAIIGKSLDGNITSWNPGAETMFGYTSAEVLGQPITLIIPQALRNQEAEILARLRAGNRIQHFETVRVRKDGSPVDVSLTISPVLDPAGSVIGISKIARDITQLRRTSEALQRQAKLLDQAYEAILVRDDHDRILYWNQGAERLYGWPPEEAKGRISHELLTTVFPEPIETIRETLLASGHWEGELTHTTRGGEKITVLSHWVREARNSSAPVLETNFDLTEQKRLIALEEQSRAEAKVERRFRELLEAAPDAIFELGSDDHIIVVNRVAERMFGYSRHELLDRQIDTLLPAGLQEQYSRHLASFSGSPESALVSHPINFEALRKDGTVFPVEVSLSRHYSETATHTTAVVRDITERKRAEEELRLLQEKFTSELAAANRELKIYAAEMERANRLKGEFLASMSHELRTPLHTILGFSQLLRERIGGELNDQQERFVRHIHSDAQHLLELINGVLDISKIEAGRLELRYETLDIAECIADAVIGAQARSAAKSITVDDRTTLAIKLQADPLRLKQVLNNLLGNAIKFTPQGGRIWVDSFVDDSFARITVSDTGVGIAVEEQTEIFERFYQAADTTLGIREGAGLGLCISKQLVELHGGRIWVESTPGHGSCFHFTLPLNTTAFANSQA